MIKYIVICYRKNIDCAFSCTFDTKKEALTFISLNEEIDEKYAKKYNDKIYSIYKLVEVILF